MHMHRTNPMGQCMQLHVPVYSLKGGLYIMYKGPVTCIWELYMNREHMLSKGILVIRAKIQSREISVLT